MEKKEETGEELKREGVHVWYVSYERTFYKFHFKVYHDHANMPS